MYVAQISSAEATRLRYQVLTDPSPLEITPEGWSPSSATISVLVSAPATVRVTQLSFVFVVGDGASDLTTSFDDAAVNVNPAGTWRLDKDGEVITAIPSAGSHVDVGDVSYVFKFSGIRINAVTGITVLTITETVDKAEQVAKFAIGKYPPGFQFGDFHPTTLEDTGGRKPKAYIEAGEKTALKWFGSEGVAYSLLYDDQVVDVTKVRSWTSPKIVRDTTFHLKATLVGGGMAFDHYLSTAVSVHQPQVTLGPSSVAGSADEGINFTVNGRLRSDGGTPGIWFRKNCFVGAFDDGTGRDALSLWTSAGTTKGDTRLRINADGAVHVLGRFEASGVWCSDDRFIGLKDVKDGRVGVFNKDGHAWLAVDGRGTTIVTGSIGVGTAKPDERLHVHGRIKLTSDGTENSGVLSVQNYVRIEPGTGQRLHVIGGTSLFDKNENGNGGDVFVVGGVYSWVTDSTGSKRGPGYYRLVTDVTDKGYKDSHPTPTHTSDGRLKTAVRPIGDAMAKLGDLQGVRFRWNEAGLDHLSRDAGDNVSAGPDATDAETASLRAKVRRHAVEALDIDNVGLIAQDVETVLPELVTEDEHGYKRVDYARLSALLVEALKEEHTRVCAIEDRMTALEAALTHTA